MRDQTNTASAEVAQETIPDMVVLLRVWWAIAWRQFLWLLVVFVALNVLSIILGVIVTSVGVDETSAETFGRIFGFVMGLIGNIWAFIMAFRQLLGKEFSGHKLLFLAPKTILDPSNPSIIP